jgi:hypothetical protein
MDKYKQMFHWLKKFPVNIAAEIIYFICRIRVNFKFSTDEFIAINYLTIKKSHISKIPTILKNKLVFNIIDKIA